MTHKDWKEQQKRTFQLHLQSTNIDGLSIDSIQAKYILQYANSLVGRQFKTLSQTSIFHIYDLTSPLTFALWNASAMLTALLWIPEIDDLELYIVSLSNLKLLR
jgi:hypothetical protein